MLLRWVRKLRLLIHMFLRLILFICFLVMIFIYFDFKKYIYIFIYLFIWLYWVLAATREVFCCRPQALHLWHVPRSLQFVGLVALWHVGS